jgi:hypothetical protein
MIGRNRRGNRRTSMKARVAVASAVIAGGAAIGAVAVASNHSAPSAAQSAGYTLNFHHRISEATALSTALNDWTTSRQKSLSTLAQMTPIKNFSTAWATQRVHGHHTRTQYAVQRGVVALATRHWLLVKSANGSLHLWLLNGKTHVMNVANSTTGTAAMTGSSTATSAAMNHGNMAPAAVTMAGSTSAVSSLNNPAPKSTTFTVSIAGSSETVTITITPSTATVAPTTPQAAQSMSQQTGTTTTTTTQPTFASTNHVKRGDLVLVAGVERHGFLWAQIVLFSAPGTTVTPPTATPTPTVSTTPTVTTTPTVNTSPTHF